MKNTIAAKRTLKRSLILASISIFLIACSEDDALTQSSENNEPSSSTSSMARDSNEPVISDAARESSASDWSESDDRSDSNYMNDDQEAYGSTGQSIESASPQNMTDNQGSSNRAADSNAISGGSDTQNTSGNKDEWNLYREYNFASNSNEISRDDSLNAGEIADYLNQNPDLAVGIDGSDEENVETVRDALIGVGIPERQILTGQFDEDALRGNGRVAVLFHR